MVCVSTRYHATYACLTWDAHQLGGLLEVASELLLELPDKHGIIVAGLGVLLRSGHVRAFRWVRLGSGVADED